MTGLPVSAPAVSAPAPAALEAVAVDAASFSREGETILDNVSLHVAEGDFLAVLGPNGGGKTTLLRLILGLLPPDSGTVRVFGNPPQEARANIGYVPQFSTIRQDFPATVLDMTLMGAATEKPRALSGGFFGRLNLWPRGAAARKKALAVLDLLGIADLAANPVHALSGGQRQRLLVARALMGRNEGEPFLLLLDEPTASIDPAGKGCFFEFLDGLRRDITMMVVSHELGMASPFFTHVALVNKTLTLTSGGCPGAEALRDFIGPHAPECPVSRLLRHAPGCGCHDAVPGEAPSPGLPPGARPLPGPGAKNADQGGKA
ncbi:ATP-binding cassette domain-containing protein [Desulfovibrio sp. OttesenSCG-928-O18]|nr:ATP-binding cassette domain-containing protein [Desulfovibrio sp. OttesenSCG-928-O18]